MEELKCKEAHYQNTGHQVMKFLVITSQKDGIMYSGAAICIGGGNLHAEEFMELKVLK